MGYRWLAFSLPGTAALPFSSAVVPNTETEEEKAMQALASKNGSAEYRVAQAIQEEAVEVKPSGWPWASIIADVLIVAAVVVTLWSIWSSWK
jgi:hypothetical protein